MKLTVKSITLLALMLLSAALGAALRPHIYLSDERPPIDLAATVPSTFGDWKKLEQNTAQIVNPQLQEKLKALYSQLLTLNYVNSNGQLIMLSISYGRDQRSYMAVHYPEVCYPAQGFTVNSNKVMPISLESGDLPVRRLETQMGQQRHEAVTYWTTIGDFHSLGGFGKRLIELKYGLDKAIPDGLLFRVSSIDKDSAKAFAVQEQFIKDLLRDLKPGDRIRLVGQKTN